MHTSSYLWLWRCKSWRVNSRPRPRDAPVTSAMLSALLASDTGAEVPSPAQALSCRGACKAEHVCHALCIARPHSHIMLDAASE